MSPYLSIVVPLYNEEESAEGLLEMLQDVAKNFDYDYEIIFIDDGSSDGTWRLIEQLQGTCRELRGIKLRRNCGQTSAMVAGFDHASGEIIVTMDGDMQNDPSDIPQLLKKMDEGYDIVSGWRRDRRDSFLRVFFSRIANAMISLTTGVRLHDYGCSLKAYRAECIRSINAYGEMHRFFPALASMTGARVTEIPVTHHPRRFGESKYGFDRILKVFSDIFAMNLIIRFSSTPLKGFVLSALPFLAMTILFGILSGMAMVLEWTQGKSIFFLVAASLNGLAVLHLFALGVLGELIVSTSDLAHTQMPEISKRCIIGNGKENGGQRDNEIFNHISA